MTSNSKLLQVPTVGLIALPALLLGVFLLGSCRDPASMLPHAEEVLAPSFSATSEWQEFPVALDWVLYNQCLAEDMHGTGTVFVRLHEVTTLSETRLLYFVTEGEDGFQVEGLTTHQIWQEVPGVHNTAMQTASGDFLIDEERFVLKNQTTGVVLDWPTKITFVVDANGEVRVARFEADACTLRH